MVQDEGKRVSPSLMREHPARQNAVKEMHLRRWPPLIAPCLVIQWVRLSTEADIADQRAIFEGYSSDPLLSESAPRHISGRLSDNIRFAWECHSEASSLTFIVDGCDLSLFRDPHGDAELHDAVQMAERLSGEVVRATRIWVASDEQDAQAGLDGGQFVTTELVSCHIGSGARIWSDFRIKSDGYGHILFAANGLNGGDLSRLVQRLQELGNYRNLALMGLPLAQVNWTRLNHVELQLRSVASDQLQADVRDDDLLMRASEISLELTSLATDANYRMSATAAYAQLVEDRLGELNVQPIAGFPSLVDFTQRRFLPAVRTCAALTRREGQLSLRASHLTSLLRMRIETRIENQNAKLLHSMERSAAMQLRLQQLVEGLSVVALSYYCLGLIGNIFKGLDSNGGHMASSAVAILTIPVVLIVWLSLHYMKRRMLR